MARYLLIEIDSNTSAERLLKQIDGMDDTKGMRVVAMFRRPTQLCECTKVAKSNHANSRPDCSLGDRFKWWICNQCRKPRAGMGQVLWNMLDEYDPELEAYMRRPAMRNREISLNVKWYRDVLGRVRTRMTPKGR